MNTPDPARCYYRSTRLEMPRRLDRLPQACAHCSLLVRQRGAHERNERIPES